MPEQKPEVTLGLCYFILHTLYSDTPYSHTPLVILTPFPYLLPFDFPCFISHSEVFMRCSQLLFMVVFLFAGTLTAQHADVIFINGKIWTVDDSHPRAEAVAVFGGRILATGTTAEIQHYASPTTKVVDLKKKLLLPGFIDNHTHFMSGGFQLQSVNLRYADSLVYSGRIINTLYRAHSLHF